MTEGSVTPTSFTSDVSVVGLGSMGSAIARALLADRRVTVWNRTPARARELVESGACLADDPAAAFRASPVTITVVNSYDTVVEWVDATASLTGRTLVNVTTGAPKDAERLEAHVRHRGGHLLDAAIFCYPQAIGNADAAIRYSGSAEGWAQHEELLRGLGGDTRYLGPEVHLANALDGAWISFYVPALTAAMEATAYGAAQGIPFPLLEQTIATALPVIGAFLHQAQARVESDDYVSDDPVDLYVRALRTAAAPFQGLGLPGHLAGAALELLQAVQSDGHGNLDFATIHRDLLGKIP